MSDSRDVLDTSGPAAPPRDNGELTFREPWESRLFGLTMALHDQGVFEWDDFRRLLIEEIAKRELADADQENWHYYECWRGAFERLMENRQLVETAELRRRTEVLAARPDGHDHTH